MRISKNFRTFVEKLEGMEKDELLKRVLMMQRLQGMETEPVSAEDPYASMEKDQLISMIHFLVRREDEPTNEARVESNTFGLYLARRRKSIAQRAQENLELKNLVKDLRDTHKQDMRTQSNLMKSIDRLTNQVADLTTQNRMISERIAELAQTLPSRD